MRRDEDGRLRGEGSGPAERHGWRRRGMNRGSRYLGSPAVSSSAAFSACSWVSSPALSMTWSRCGTVIELDAFAALRIFTVAGINFGWLIRRSGGWFDEESD